MKKGSYCCFNCPSKDYTEKFLDDPCPTCQKPYSFPLQDKPERIKDYNVIEAKGRGFYAATYLCERGKLHHKYLLKVSPKTIYQFFGKDFSKEPTFNVEVQH